jgi:hypothetical protein
MVHALDSAATVNGRLLASSPELHTRNLTVVPISALLFYLEKCTRTCLFLQIFLLMCILWMRTKQLCITSAKRIHAYTHIGHTNTHTRIYISDYFSVGEFKYVLWCGVGFYMRFVAYPITGLYVTVHS